MAYIQKFTFTRWLRSKAMGSILDQGHGAASSQFSSYTSNNNIKSQQMILQGIINGISSLNFQKKNTRCCKRQCNTIQN